MTHREEYRAPYHVTLCGLDREEVALLGDRIHDLDEWREVNCEDCRERMRCAGCGEPWNHDPDGHRRCAEIP